MRIEPNAVVLLELKHRPATRRAARERRRGRPASRSCRPSGSSKDLRRRSEPACRNRREEEPRRRAPPAPLSPEAFTAIDNVEPFERRDRRSPARSSARDSVLCSSSAAGELKPGKTRRASFSVIQQRGGIAQLEVAVDDQVRCWLRRRRRSGRRSGRRRRGSRWRPAARPT